MKTLAFTRNIQCNQEFARYAIVKGAAAHKIIGMFCQSCPKSTNQMWYQEIVCIPRNNGWDDTLCIGAITLPFNLVEIAVTVM